MVELSSVTTMLSRLLAHCPIINAVLVQTRLCHHQQGRRAGPSRVHLGGQRAGGGHCFSYLAQGFLNRLLGLENLLCNSQGCVLWARLVGLKFQYPMCHETLGKLPDLHVPQFCHLSNGDKSNPDFI